MYYCYVNKIVNKIDKSREQVITLFRMDDIYRF